MLFIYNSTFVCVAKKKNNSKQVHWCNFKSNIKLLLLKLLSQTITYMSKFHCSKKATFTNTFVQWRFPFERPRAGRLEFLLARVEEGALEREAGCDCFVLFNNVSCSSAAKIENNSSTSTYKSKNQTYLINLNIFIYVSLVS